VNILNRVIARGLAMSGRKCTVTLELSDKPGQLTKVSEIISACGANVVAVHHDSRDPNMDITSCFLKVIMETRDGEQADEIKKELRNAGFRLVTERT
jgi:threonine dehydratase